MSPSDSPSATTTIPGLSGTGTQVARLTIQIIRTVPIDKILDPPAGTPLQISFTHPQGVPTHAKPHGIEWVALNLQANERIEIQLDTRFPGYADNPVPFHLKPWWEHLLRLFPTADVVPSGAFGWELKPGAASAVSGHAATTDRFDLKNDGAGDRPVVQYRVVFFDASGVKHLIDPEIVVTPDP